MPWHVNALMKICQSKRKNKSKLPQTDPFSRRKPLKRKWFLPRIIHAGSATNNSSQSTSKAWWNCTPKFNKNHQPLTWSKMALALNLQQKIYSWCTQSRWLLKMFSNNTRTSQRTPNLSSSSRHIKGYSRLKCPSKYRRLIRKSSLRVPCSNSRKSSQKLLLIISSRLRGERSKVSPARVTRPGATRQRLWSFHRSNKMRRSAKMRPWKSPQKIMLHWTRRLCGCPSLTFCRKVFLTAQRARCPSAAIRGNASLKSQKSTYRTAHVCWTFLNKDLYRNGVVWIPNNHRSLSR